MYMKNFVTTMTLVALLGVAPAFAESNNTLGSFQEKKDDIKAKIEDRRGEDGKPIITLDATQIACIKTAITKREDALIAGHDVYAIAVKNAYTTRKTALLAAWDKTDRLERRAAVKAADKAFSDGVKAARKTWNETRRGAWKTFETERKACLPQTASSASVSSSDTGSSKSDASL